MIAKITNKMRRLNSLKVWSAITGIALTIALVFTFLPVQVSVNTEGLLSISLRQASANPGIGEYSYKKQLTFNTTGISVTSNQTNFPICVHINTSSWATEAERTAFFGAWNVGGKRCQFFDADGTTNLDYEVELYASGTTEAIYWVRAPQVDGNSTTDYVWVAFGNDPNGTNQDNKTGVWTSTYKFVNHLADWNMEAYKSRVYIAVAGENYYTAEPMVIYRAGETHPFQMWLAVNYPTPRIYNYYSDDGSAWTSNGLASPNSYYLQPHVLWNPEGDNKYWLYASDTFGDHFDLLTSSNETGFTLDTADVLVKSGDNTKFDETAVYNPTIWYEEPDSTANLTTSMDDSTTECDVTDTSKFAANQYIKIESEWMLVTTVVNATHCHVTRARYGTTAVTHTQPQDVYKRQYYMAYDGAGTPNGGYIRVGLATSYDGRVWTKQYNGSGAGGSWLLATEAGSDAGTIYKVNGVYYHCGHGDWVNGGAYTTYVQGWCSSTDLASWSALGGTGYESFIPQTQAWEGIASTTGQTADLCGLADNNANPVTVGGYSFFYYTAWMQQSFDSSHPLSIGLVKPLGTFSEVVINSPATIGDSTSNSNNPDRRDYLSLATGQVGNAENWYLGSKVAILRFPKSANLCPTPITVEVWIKADAFTNAYNALVDFYDDTQGHSFMVKSNGKLAVYLQRASPYQLVSYDGTGTYTLSAGTWYHLAYTYDNSTLYGYRNADQDKSVSGTVTIGVPTGDDLYIGKSHFATRNFDGLIDEVRISNTARSADWIKLEYYSMLKTNFNGDSWLSWGSQEASAAPAITNTPNSKDFGTLEVNTTSNTTLTYFTLNNTGNCAVDIAIQGTNLVGGDDTWTLSGDAAPGENIYGLKAGLSGGDYTVVVNTTANSFVSDLAEGLTQAWGLKIYMPTSVANYDAQQMSGNITLIASAA